MSYESAIQTALYERLTGYPALSDVPVYDHVPQPTDTGSQGFPYISFGDDSFVEWDTATETGVDGLIFLHVWSRYPGRKEVKDIQGHLYDALHRYELSVNGYELVTLEWEQSESFMDPDGLTRHGVSRFRVLLES